MRALAVRVAARGRGHGLKRDDGALWEVDEKSGAIEDASDGQFASSVVPAGRRFAAKQEQRRRVPVSDEQAAGRDGSAPYRIAAVDHRGRVAESSLMRLLGWEPGARVEVAMRSGVVLVRRSSSAAFRLTRRGHVQLPLAVRRWCDLGAGDRVLLAAAPDADVLVVHTMAALDDMVRAFHTRLFGSDQP